LRRDGRVEAWGENNYAQCDIPEGGQFAAIAAGDFHSLAIRDTRKQFLSARSAEPQDAPAKPPEGLKTTSTPVLGEIEPATVKEQQPKDPNSLAAGAGVKQSLTVQEPNQVKPVAAAPAQDRDPNAVPAGPKPVEPVKTAAVTTEKRPAVTKTDPLKQPPPPQEKAATAAEPNKPALDLESPANQGYAPSVYMGVIENASPVYHFISTKTKRHFCTISEEEKYKLLDERPSTWKYQGIAFFAYAEGHQPKDARPVYRFRSESLGQYFYTMDETTKDMMIKDLPNVWKFEGVAWYAPPIKQPGQKR
jgi:hypothetical protein